MGNLEAPTYNIHLQDTGARRVSCDPHIVDLEHYKIFTTRCLGKSLAPVGDVGHE